MKLNLKLLICMLVTLALVPVAFAAQGLSLACTSVPAGTQSVCTVSITEAVTASTFGAQFTIDAPNLVAGDFDGNGYIKDASSVTASSNKLGDPVVLVTLKKVTLQPKAPVAQFAVKTDKVGNYPITLKNLKVGSSSLPDVSATITFTDKPDVACTSWSTVTWGACSNDKQTGTVTKLPSGCTGADPTGKPSLVQSCGTNTGPQVMDTQGCSPLWYYQTGGAGVKGPFSGCQKINPEGIYQADYGAWCPKTTTFKTINDKSGYFYLSGQVEGTSYKSCTIVAGDQCGKDIDCAIGLTCVVGTCQSSKVSSFTVDAGDANTKALLEAVRKNAESVDKNKPTTKLSAISGIAKALQTFFATISG